MVPKECRDSPGDQTAMLRHRKRRINKGPDAGVVSEENRMNVGRRGSL